jgi:membrane-associated phospholipid phosphatase
MTIGVTYPPFDWLEHPTSTMITGRRRIFLCRIFVCCAAIFGVAASARAQEVTTCRAPRVADTPPALDNTRAPAQDEDVTWRKFPKNVLRDQKDIWLFPVQLAKGYYWLPTLVTVGGTAGLVVADPHAMPYFRRHAGNLDDLNDTFDGPITTGMVALIPVSIMIGGYIRHDTYAVKTALLAGQAYADTAIVDLAIKAVTRRKRPIDVAPGAPFNDTFFSGGKSPLKGSAFPSGHSAGAFAIATVVARRYGDRHHWVPWVVYGFAGAISFSRVTTRAHFPSDVFLGAALGYTITRFEVLRPR